MDAVLRQSKAMCPFMKTATPATLRALSTSTRALPAPASPCGGTMSKLQLLGQRCPVMGKAMAVQTAKSRAAGSVRAFSGHSKTGKAKIHTTRNKEARAVDRPLFDGRDNGT
jgi:5-aminolevulinate synthase